MDTTHGTQAIDTLMQEHREILRVLVCLQRIADAAARQGRLNGDDARDAIEFLRTFADDCHHGKEEEGLFAALLQRGFPRDAGPVAVMLEEHDSGRATVVAMAQHIAGAERGEPNEVAAFVRHAVAYVELLRDHIAKEDNVLFPMAVAFLGPAESEALAERFEQLDRQQPAGTYERMGVLADELARRYGFDRMPGGSGLGHTGCTDGGRG